MVIYTSLCNKLEKSKAAAGGLAHLSQARYSPRAENTSSRYLLLHTCWEEPEGCLRRSRGWEHLSHKAVRGHAGHYRVNQYLIAFFICWNGEINPPHCLPALTRAGSCSLKLPEAAWARSQRALESSKALPRSLCMLWFLATWSWRCSQPVSCGSGQLYFVELFWGLHRAPAAPCSLLSIPLLASETAESRAEQALGERPLLPSHSRQVLHT